MAILQMAAIAFNDQHALGPVDLPAKIMFRRVSATIVERHNTAPFQQATDNDLVGRSGRDDILAIYQPDRDVMGC